MDLFEQFIDEAPEPSLEERFRPQHEASLVAKGGKFRWTCICGDQQSFPPTEDMEAVMRSYAIHTGLIEKRK